MAKAIREAYGKGVLSGYLWALISEDASGGKELSFPVQTATVTPKTDFGQLAKENPWLETKVLKPGDLDIWKCVTLIVVWLLATK